MEHTPTYKTEYRESLFTGDMFGILAVNLVTVFVTGMSFSLAYPWILCWREKWFKEHTYINGRQLYFTGTGMRLFGNWLKWILLTIITFGIYAFWLPVKIEQWSVKHTCFADQALFAPKESEFDFVEWVKNLAGTIKTYTLVIWDKLYSWANGVIADHTHQRNIAAPGSWTCSCGHSTPKGSVFCNMCGSKLPDFHFENYEMCEACCSLVEKGTDIRPNSKRPMRLQNDNQVKCRNCGEFVGKDNRFCPICREPLFLGGSNDSEDTSPKEKKCSKCGSMMSPDKLFCTECGTRLN